MRLLFVFIAFLLNFSLAFAASGVTVEQENYSQDVQWAGYEKFTVTAEQVLHIDDRSLLEDWQIQQKIFKGVRIEVGAEKDIYLASAKNDEGFNPNDNAMSTLCHTLAGPDYYAQSGVYKVDVKTQITSSSERSIHYLSTPRMFVFNQKTEKNEDISCGPWAFTVKDYAWGTARYVENLICEQTDPNSGVGFRVFQYANECF